MTPEPSAYSDDLRRKILEAYGRGSVSLAELAQRFGMSHGYSKKIRKQQLRRWCWEEVWRGSENSRKLNTSYMELRHYLTGHMLDSGLAGFYTMAQSARSDYRL